MYTCEQNRKEISRFIDEILKSVTSNVTFYQIIDETGFKKVSICFNLLRHCFLQIFNFTVNICVMKMCGKEKRHSTESWYWVEGLDDSTLFSDN